MHIRKLWHALAADAVGQERREVMLFFATLGYALCVLVLMRVMPRSVVVISAVAVPLGLGWVSWGEITSGPALIASHGLGLAIAGWAALSDLKGIARFFRGVQWYALWHMARGREVIALEEEGEDLTDEEVDGAEVRA